MTKLDMIWIAVVGVGFVVHVIARLWNGKSWHSLSKEDAEFLQKEAAKHGEQLSIAELMDEENVWADQALEETRRPKR